MVVVTNGCQDKGENGTHFILVVFMSSSRFSGGKEDDRSKIDCHTQSCQFPADRFWNSSNYKVLLASLRTKENFQIGHLEVSDNLDVIAEVAVYFDSLKKPLLCIHKGTKIK